jgi:tRNA (cytidine/uridine-2'-O-)-methyltransferase
VHENLDEFFSKHLDKAMYFATTKGKKSYTDVKFKDEDMIVFGKETAGLPKEIIQKNIENAIRIPMTEDIQFRSLNLSNAVNIVLFEALRQLGFPNLK